MAVTRRNFLAVGSTGPDYIAAVLRLNAPASRLRTSDLQNYVGARNLPVRIRGIDQPLSTYDIFVFWHVLAMSLGFSVGNAAHQGPIFLPWHRMYLIRFEEALRRVTGTPNFALPYWDWAADGELTGAAQVTAPIWNNSHLGSSRGFVTTGPLANFRVRLVQDASTGDLVSINPRPLRRDAGAGTRRLPRKADVAVALAPAIYDAPPWSIAAIGHRNRNEGWLNGPQMHNRVHVWVGGDMSPGSSPNDPVFFLNHCNVDRIWERWMTDKGRIYAPGAGQGPAGHRINDTMVSIIGAAMTPQQVLDVSQSYTYDTLN